ncbi:MAG: 50S ribosomal protein L6 [Nanoarchaeota archaeon]|nr:50S ribosomal protein L6 [Nanoarchaeota archaeon]
MIEARKLRKEIVIPEGVEVNIVDRMISMKKGSNEIKKELYFPTVSIQKNDNHLVIEPNKFSKREKKIINTFAAHLRNMIKGVEEPFTYKVKICSSHFPMTVNINGNKIIVKNFLGEKIPRVANIVEGADVKIEGDVIVIKSNIIEAAGQTAGNCEKSTRITNRDRRIFQDGLWIIEKAGKEL